MISSDGAQHTHSGIRVCYAESKDGIHWVKPKLGFREFNGSKENNILLDRTDNAFDNFFVFIDENPACPPEEKYKGISLNNSDIGRLICFVSPDGLNPMTDNQWFTGIRDIRYIKSEDFRNWSEPKLLDFGDADDYALYTNCIIFNP